MDDLLREFLTETSESLDTVDNQLVRFEQEPNNAKILDNIFRLVHTIKGTCGFLGLPRLEALAHAGETLMGKFRDGMPVTAEAVTLILGSIDRIKEILAGLEATEAEPEGTDQDLIAKLQEMVERGMAAMSARRSSAGYAGRVGAGRIRAGGAVAAAPRSRRAPWCRRRWSGRCVPAKCRWMNWSARSARPRPRLRRHAPPRAPRAASRSRARGPRDGSERDKAGRAAKSVGRGRKCPKPIKVANQSIRVNVDTLEHLMTMVSELVLTRNQLLEISRRNEDTEFKVPLQRLSNVTAELQEGVMKTRMQPIGNAWQKLPRIVRDLSRRTRQADRTGDARRRHRARPPGARPDQGSADPHGAQLRRSRAGDAGRARGRPASRSRAPSGCRPITKAATSSSASPTTAEASTPRRSRPRRSRAVSSARPNWRR